MNNNLVANRLSDPSLTLTANDIVGSVEHSEYGKNDDWQWGFTWGSDPEVHIQGARIRIPMWHVWRYRILVVHASATLGCGDDWIEEECGYKSTMAAIMAIYASFKARDGLYREVKLEVQEFTFTETCGYEVLDCR